MTKIINHKDFEDKRDFHNMVLILTGRKPHLGGKVYDIYQEKTAEAKLK